MQQVACAILIQRGTILLGRRAAHKRICPDRWDLVGGHLETGEGPIHAYKAALRLASPRST
jgi:8-oxo-dGTP diphosphatase